MTELLPNSIGPSSFSAGPSPESSDSLPPSERLMKHFVDTEIQPVLIFGTGSSGKTTMLHSLIDYARNRGRPELRLDWDENFRAFPGDYESADKRQEAAVIFMNTANGDFAKGIIPHATYGANPFFVPVSINTPVGRHRLAFLEGMGEWYERNEQTPHLFNSFREEVTDILENYERGLTIILVAPVIGSNGPKGHTKEYSHECLSNVLDRYARIRSNRSRDRILLLASKWDALYAPDNPHGHFSDADPAIFLETVRNWRMIWQAFSTLKGISVSARAAMPYSAAWIEEVGGHAFGEAISTSRSLIALIGLCGTGSLRVSALIARAKLRRLSMPTWHHCRRS